jgi:hypothetical protein
MRRALGEEQLLVLGASGLRKRLIVMYRVSASLPAMISNGKSISLI